MRIILPAIAAFILSISAIAQDIAQPELKKQSWDVFARSNAESPLLTDIIFVDQLSGNLSTVSAFGERFTLTQSGVIYVAQDEEGVKLAKADGMVRDHPFIHVDADTRRVDWVVSRDGRHIAWTISRQTTSDQLVTATWLADVSGAEIRELLVYGPRDGLQLLPVSFGAGQRELYMEVYAEGSDNLSPYTRRAGIFALEIGPDQVNSRILPGDQTCFCPVGFGAASMLRLVSDPEQPGLNVEIYGLENGAVKVIPALSRGNYRDGGNILVTADGKRAVYALSQVLHFATEKEEIRTVLVLVDSESGRQSIVGSPILELVRPIEFSDDNRTVLISPARSGGTWKVDLEDASMVKISDATYLGRYGGN